MKRRLKRWLSSATGWRRLPFVALEGEASPFFHDFRAVQGKSYLREQYIRDLAAGKRVLHFGFLDAPFVEQKIASGDLLHSKIRGVARRVFGVDIDPEGLSLYRRLSNDDENLIWDVQGELTGAARDELCNPGRRAFDLIVFSEVLEHLLNPGQALANLHAIFTAHRCTLCVTVPNALSLIAFTNAMQGIETVHPDHYAYYSPHTLRKALHDSGFSSVELAFYSSPDTLTTPGLTKHGIIALATPAGS